MDREGLFAGFDPALVAQIEEAQARELVAEGHARAMRTRSRHQMRRAKSEKVLAELLPRVIEPGETWHVISHGDVDSLSYLAHVIEPTYFDTVSISTWCIAATDLDRLAEWLNTGRIGHLDLYLGEIFPGQYVGEYEQATKMRRDYGVGLKIARNHSKVMLAGNASTDTWLVSESSANVNTNPRIEQTSITNDRALFEFYRDFFNGLHSIDRAAH